MTGAVVIAAAVLLTNGSSAVTAAVAAGRYMVSSADIVAYELDTDTGAIRACMITTPRESALGQHQPNRALPNIVRSQGQS